MKKLIKYITAFILIAIPLYPKFPLINVPGTFVSIRLEDILLLLATSVLAIYIIKNNFTFEALKIRVVKYYLIYLAVGFLSVLSAILLTKTVSPSISILHLLRRLEYFIPLLLGIYSIKSDKNNLNFFLNVLLIVMAIVFIYGVGQKYFYWPIIITQNEEYSKGVALRYVPGGHINSTFAGHYDLGTFLIIALPLFLSVFAVVKSRIRYLYAFGFLSGLWLMVNSASRISLVSYLMSSFIALILLKKKKLIIPLVLITLIFAATSTNLVSRYERIIEVTRNQFSHFNLLNYVVKEADAQTQNILPDKIIQSVTPTPVPVFEDRSSNIRLNVEWPRALRALTKNPFLGTGYSSITLATDNDYLRSLGETGLLGFFAFLLLILNLLLEFVKAFPLKDSGNILKKIFVASVFASIPGVLLNAVFIDVFEASKFAILFWLLMGLAIGVIKYDK